MSQITILVVLFVTTKIQGCEDRNISYDDIKTDDGFKFPYECPEGNEISVDDNKTTIAYRGPDNQTFECSSEVHRINNHSVVTRDCRDLQVKCFVPNGGSQVKEICVNYKVTGKAMRCGNPSFGKIMDAAQQSSRDKYECNIIKEKVTSLEPGDPPQGLIIGVPLLVILGIIGIVGMLCYCYTRWKKKQRGAATFSGFLSYLRTGCCLRKNSQAEREEEQKTGVAKRDSVQEVIVDKSGTQQNGVIRRSGVSAPDPHNGSRENDIKPDDTLRNVLVHSIDPDADGTTPRSFSLDRNLSNGGIQPAENGDISAPDVNRAMHRIVRDDPGGVCYNKGKDAVRIMAEPSGWTHSDGGREDHGSEGRPLLSYQGAALQGSDMTGEASDQVSRCSTAPDADVESTLKIKNYGEHKY